MEKVFTVNNPSGIHARPATLLVQKAAAFSCDISLVKDGKKVNAKSIMGVMSLALRKDDSVTVIASGEQEQAAVAEIGQILASVHE